MSKNMNKGEAVSKAVELPKGAKPFDFGAVGTDSFGARLGSKRAALNAAFVDGVANGAELAEKAGQYLGKPVDASEFRLHGRYMANAGFTFAEVAGKVKLLTPAK